MNLSKRQIQIIVGVIAAIIVLVGIRQVIAARNSQETDKIKAQVLNVCLNGWQIKELARLDVNKDKARDFKQQLMNFYDAKSGELAEQQRLIDMLIAADKEKDDKDIDTNTPLQVLGFSITGIKVQGMNVGGDSADVGADIEYYIKYDTQHQNYSALVKNTYKWHLKKEKDSWKIIDENLVTGDEQ